MDVTPEQIEELFKKPIPDSQICLHEFRIQPIALDGDENNARKYGYVARLMGHAADGSPHVIDFLTTEDVLQEMMNRMCSAGMSAALAAAMDIAAADSSPDGLLAILSLLPDAPESDDL